MLDLENTQVAIVRAVHRQEQTVQTRSNVLVTLLGSELDLTPMSGTGLNGRLSSKGAAALDAPRPFSIRLDGTFRSGGGADDMGIAGATAATPVSRRLSLGGSIRKASTSEGDALSVATYLRSREVNGTGLTWRGALGYSSGDVALVRDASLSNTEVGEGETSVRSYAATAELGYDIIQTGASFTPFARLTRSTTRRDGYVEAETAAFPVTYDNYTLTTTTLTVGVDGRRDLSGSALLRFGAGVEFDVARSDEALMGTSRVPGLETIAIEAPDVRNKARPYLSLGANKAMTNGSIMTFDIGAQMTSYSNDPMTHVSIGYQMNF